MCVCLCVCVSCLCRPPSHWWISFMFYTIIGLDPEGGQWLFKFKSNHNKKINQQNAKQYMWDCNKKLNRKHTNSDTDVGFENEMVSAVQCSASTWLHKTQIYYPLNSMELRTLLSLRKSFKSVHKVMRMHGMQDTLAYFGDSLTSVASVTRAHSNVFCGIVSTD